MSAIRPKGKYIRHSTNPYDDSDDEDDDFSQDYSQSARSGRSTLPSRSSLSLSTRRKMGNILNQRDALMLAQMQLEDERRRGKGMLCACIVLGCVCLLLFKDRWPEDFRGALLNLLDDGKHQTATPFDPVMSTASTGTSTGTGNVRGSSNDGSVNDFINQHTSQSGSGPSSSSTQSTNAYTNANTGNSGSAASTSNNAYALVEGEGGTNSGANSTESTPNHPSQIQGEGEVEDAPAVRPPPNELIVAVPTEDQKKQSAEEAQIEELQQHLDNLSKYLKWNLPYKSDRDVPVFWVIPLSGTALLDQVLGKCYALVQAADKGDLITGHEDDKILNVVTEEDGSKYVNVDLGNIIGIKRAQDLRLTNAGVADVLRSSYLYEMALLFQSSARYGKCFTMIRNPIGRAVDVFRKLKGSSSNPVFDKMTLEEYVKGPFIEDNWMVRFLTNEMEGRLEQHHLDLAKHVLGRKCFVGLTEEFNESMRRYAKYFDWDKRSSNEAVAACMRELQVTQHLTEAEFSLSMMSPKIPTHEYEAGTEVYRILSEKNVMDLQLYEYAKQLFQRQSLYSRNRNLRNRDE